LRQAAGGGETCIKPDVHAARDCIIRHLTIAQQQRGARVYRDGMNFDFLFILIGYNRFYTCVRVVSQGKCNEFDGLCEKNRQRA
jgi:hypothetical protein